jgi:hypothetical protein
MAGSSQYHWDVDLRELLPDRWKVHQEDKASKNAELCRNFMEELAKQNQD